MKRILFILFLVTVVNAAAAQTMEEWTQQKATQKKYLVEQIAALKVYNRYVQKGFAITKEGLTIVGHIKRGDFKLHEDYFTSLEKVNPQIKEDVRIAAMIALQGQMLRAFTSTHNQLKENIYIKREEVEYCYLVMDKLMNECLDNINELIQIISNGSLHITDDERIKRIAALYTDMQEKSSFLQSFGYQFKVLALQRKREENNIQVTRQLYEKK